MKRSVVRGLACCLAGVLFVAQMTVAAYACPGVSLAIAAGAPAGPMKSMQAMTQRAVAFAAQNEVRGESGATSKVAKETTAAPMPNCSDMAGGMDADAANLCAEHCKYGQQSDHASTLTVPAVILNALYTMPAVAQVPLARSAAALAGVPVAASAPHAILHCVFRI